MESCFDIVMMRISIIRRFAFHLCKMIWMLLKGKSFQRAERFWVLEEKRLIGQKKGKKVGCSCWVTYRLADINTVGRKHHVHSSFKFFCLWTTDPICHAPPIDCFITSPQSRFFFEFPPLVCLSRSCRYVGIFPLPRFKAVDVLFTQSSSSSSFMPRLSCCFFPIFVCKIKNYSALYRYK